MGGPGHGREQEPRVPVSRERRTPRLSAGALQPFDEESFRVLVHGAHLDPPLHTRAKLAYSPESAPNLLSARTPVAPTHPLGDTATRGPSRHAPYATPRQWRGSGYARRRHSARRKQRVGSGGVGLRTLRHVDHRTTRNARSLAVHRRPERPTSPGDSCTHRISRLLGPMVRRGNGQERLRQRRQPALRDAAADRRHRNRRHPPATSSGDAAGGAGPRRVVGRSLRARRRRLPRPRW